MSIKILRRTLTFISWPFVDSGIAVFANFMIFHRGVIVATFSTAVVSVLANIGLLYLFYQEKILQRSVMKHVNKTILIRFKKLATWMGKTATILIVYSITGPAMFGTPLVWMFGIPPKRAYLLIIVGLSINALIWVGGIYNILWIFIHLMLRRI